MLMKTLIVLLFVSILWSCAATRHTTVPADVQNEVMRLVEDRDYRVLFGRQFLTPDGVYLLNGESGMLTVSGNVLVYASFPSDQQVMLRIRDYRLSLTKKGEVEITFSVEEYKNYPVNYKLKIYSPQKLELTMDKLTYQGEIVTYM